MMDKNSQFQSIYAQGLKTYPQKSKQEVQQITNELWKKVKANEKTYEEVLRELKTKSTTTKSKLTGFWSTLPKKKDAETKVNIEPGTSICIINFVSHHL